MEALKDLHGRKLKFSIFSVYQSMEITVMDLDRMIHGYVVALDVIVTTFLCP